MTLVQGTKLIEVKFTDTAEFIFRNHTKYEQRDTESKLIGVWLVRTDVRKASFKADLRELIGME